MKNPQELQQMVKRRVRRRRLLRRARIGSFVAAIAVVAGGLAFGIDRMVVSLYHYYGGNNKALAHTPTTSRTVPPSTTTTAAGPPDCASSGLGAVVSNWQAAAGVMYQTISLTNISDAPCTLAGYPTLGVTSSDGTPLPAPTSNVPELGATTAGATGPTTSMVALAPQAVGWFEISYPEVCYQILTGGTPPTSSPDQCYAGTILEVTPPGATSPLLVTEPIRFNYQTSGFMVGPFLPGPAPHEPPIAPVAPTA
jgi:hypothetical protein